MLTIGATHHGFWGMHSLQEVFRPSRTPAFKSGSLHVFREDIASCKEAQKCAGILSEQGSQTFQLVHAGGDNW